MVIIPRPISDVVEATLTIRDFANSMKNRRDDIMDCIFEGGIFTLLHAEKMVKATARTALAALGVFALVKLGGSLAVAATVGSLISLPAVVVVGGSWLLYQGTTAIVASLASGSFTTLGIGLASVAGGWLALEGHDIIPFGLGELFIDQVAQVFSLPIVRAIAS